MSTLPPRPPAELDLRAAQEYSEQWRRSQTPATPPVAAQIADCISCGLVGMALVQALQRHFPNASRGDVYLAIGAAVALIQAEATLSVMHELAPSEDHVSREAA